ncbi:hypothetical protein, partial [Escherichia coli]|uniref:hypothetical protein n=1 Tax=Escherichia coli TaxID=562 RepID=UPI00374CE9D6
MGSCAAPSAKGDDKFITTDYLQQCPESIYYKRKYSTINAHTLYGTFVPGHDYLCSMSPHDRLNIQNITFPKKPEMIKNELNEWKGLPLIMRLINSCAIMG